MLSSAVVFFILKQLWGFRVLNKITSFSERNNSKKLILNWLLGFQKYSFNKLASKAIIKSLTVFDGIAGSTRLTGLYFVRLLMISIAIGVFLALISLFTLAYDFSQFGRFLYQKNWWEIVVFPSTLISIIFFPLDFLTAHLILKWASVRSQSRALLAISMGAPIAYFNWSICGGIGAIIWPLIKSGYFSLSFTLNRISESFQHPWNGAATIQVGENWISYQIIAIVGGLNTFVVTIVFLVVFLLHNSGDNIKKLISHPFFWVLTTINYLNKKLFNLNIGLFVYIAIFVLFVLGVFLKFLDFQ